GFLFAANLQRPIGARSGEADKAESAVVSVIGINRAGQLTPLTAFGTEGATFGWLRLRCPFPAIELGQSAMNHERFQGDAFRPGFAITPGIALGGIEGKPGAMRMFDVAVDIALSESQPCLFVQSGNHGRSL